jgi:hypothetical protein
MAEDPDFFISETAEHASANPISLAHVLALSVPVHWTEAVAVVEELCQTLTATGGADALVPDPQDVLITAQGALMVRRAAPLSADVASIGRLLNALLDPVTTPIPLRLFVAHSIGSEKYRSVASYGEALVYYARPDRTELIQALYRRCLESSETVVLPVMTEAAPLEPLPAETVPPPEPLMKRRRIPRWAPPAAVAALLVASLYFGAKGLMGPSAPSLISTLVAAAAKAVASVESWVAPSPAPAVAAQPVEAAEVSVTAPARSRRPTGASSQTGAGEARQASAESSATSGLVSPQSTADSDTFVPVDPPRQASQGLTPIEPSTVAEGALALAPVVTITPGRSVVADPKVYSSASREVLPPVMYAPKLPPLPPAAPNALGTNTMELLIDESGAVQQVQLTSRPLRLPDMQLLSAAKTWKFYPALKDGQPVSYRLSLSWVVAPP